jgi:preprotein translocase subunit YajC
MGSLVLLLLIPLAMWFLVLRPQQARLRAQRELVASLEAGDRVVTVGGIIGTLTVVGDTEVTLVTTPGVELQVLRGAVSRRLDPPAGPDEVIDVDDPDDRGG